MSCSIIDTPEATGCYATAWLRWMAKDVDADVRLMYVCDPLDLGPLMAAHKQDGPPIVVGGPESACARLLSYYADMVCVGEGFAFFDALKSGVDVAADLPCTYTGSRRAVSSTYVDWSRLPLLKYHRSNRAIVTGRGCKSRCRFCYASWTTKYQQRPMPPGFQADKKTHQITNDNTNSVTLRQPAHVRSIRLRDYLELSPAAIAACKNWRIGIEGFTESTRRMFAKPMYDTDIIDAIVKAQSRKHNLKLFFIAGLDTSDDIKALLTALPMTLKPRPVVDIKVTWFNPMPHTPLAEYDITRLHTVSKRHMWAWLKGRGAAYKLTMCADSGKAIFRTFVHRAETRAECDEIWKHRNWTGARQIEWAVSHGLSHLISGQTDQMVDLPWKVPVYNA